MITRTSRKAGPARLILLVLAVAAACAIIPAGSAAKTAIGAGSPVAYTWPGAKLLTVGTSSDGSGYVRSTPYQVDCPGACVRPFAVGAVVVVQATPSAGYAFTGWSGGACSADRNPCVLTITHNTALVARFERRSYRDGRAEPGAQAPAGRA
jgi:Divergent InlB B-repeat domain